ncbi:MAG TPA: hypothetical protein VIB49_06250 [Thermoplasmata archaeon]
MLKAAFLGLNQLSSRDPPVRLAGLWDMVIYGRAVTNILQNLRGVDRVRFDLWYAPHKAEMEQDELMKFFYKLRSNILKKGARGVDVRARIHYLDSSQTQRAFGPPPENATGIFIGDEIGGSGWVVRLPDGTVEKHYAELDPKTGEVELYFDDPPKSHLGKPLQDKDPIRLGMRYLAYLSNLVEDAKRAFPG